MLVQIRLQVSELIDLVFMNHLDIGFDGIDPIIGYAINVINKYVFNPDHLS